MVNDPIADMFSRIKNAQRARRPLVHIPYSKIKMDIAKFLESKKLVGEINRRGKQNKRNIELTLLYDDAGQAKIAEIKRASKPSRRVYAGWRELKPVKGGRGSYIISSPEGIIDGKKARQLKIGGEILGIVW